MSDFLLPHELQHARPTCPSPTPGIHSDSRPSSQWCHPAISSSVVLFSCCPQSLPSSESFPMSQLFTKVTESQVRYYIARFSWHLKLGHCYFYENFGKWGTKCLALDGEMWNSSKGIFFSQVSTDTPCITSLFQSFYFWILTQKVWALSLGTMSFTLLTRKVHNFITFICLFYESNYCTNQTCFFSFPFFCYLLVLWVWPTFQESLVSGWFYCTTI